MLSNSFSIVWYIAFLLPKMRSYEAIFAIVFLCSSKSACNSSPINLDKRSSKIAVACASVNKSFAACLRDFSVRKLIPSVIPSDRHAFAIFKVLLPRIISIIKSITSTARIRPSWISFLSSSFSRSTLYLCSVFWYWNSMKLRRIPFKFKVSGLPSAIASILTPNVSSNFVFL